MILGLNLSHDSSVCLADDNGVILYAASEERFSRKKHHTIFPRKSLSWICSQVDPGSITRVCVAGFSTTQRVANEQIPWMFRSQEFDSFDGHREYRFPPSVHSKVPFQMDLFEQECKKELHQFGINSELSFYDHHLSHAMSAIIPSGFDSGVVLTLDGEGDGSSGLIANFKTDNKVAFSNLKRFPVKNSLGYFYSAVTNRYNFKMFSHEGKITGLAAYGKDLGNSYSYLSKKVFVKDGAPFVSIPNNNFSRALLYLLRKGTNSRYFISEVQDIVDTAADSSSYFEELASSAQAVLEDVVLGIIEEHFKVFGRQDYALAGGVFSNVVLNQRIAESSMTKKVYVYPNMGDGGLAVGSIYNYVSDLGILNSKLGYEFTPYLGNYASIVEPEHQLGDFKVTRFHSVRELCQHMVSQLLNGKILGLVQGRMEFGPRALMNRSIIATPSDPSVNQVLNQRLNRTEFMPFAPVVRIENLEKVFEIEKFEDLRGFNYMTTTCRVRQKFRSLIPAVVHVDGTARPQVVTKEDNPVAWELLKLFEDKTGIPCLVNTSFNVHEEPIVCTLKDAVYALKYNRVDLVFTDKIMIENSN